MLLKPAPGTKKKEQIKIRGREREKEEVTQVRR